MEKIIAYCGLVCSDCPAYVATQAHDMAALEKLAADAREKYGQPNATAESSMCDGCLGDNPHKCGYIAECEERACGVSREVTNCGACADYVHDGVYCEKIVRFWAMAPTKELLDQIHASIVS